MKPAPAAYIELLEREKKSSEEATRQAERRRAYESEQEKGLFYKISAALADYDDVELDGHYLTVKNLESKNTVKLYVGRIHWMTFRPERHYSNCHCENVCDHETSTWITLKSIQHKKDGTEYGAYFSCAEDDLRDPAKVAYAMKKVMNDFNWR